MSDQPSISQFRIHAAEIDLEPKRHKTGVHRDGGVVCAVHFSRCGATLRNEKDKNRQRSPHQHSHKHRRQIEVISMYSLPGEKDNFSKVCESQLADVFLAPE